MYFVKFSIHQLNTIIYRLIAVHYNLKSDVNSNMLADAILLHLVPLYIKYK